MNLYFLACQCPSIIVTHYLTEFDTSMNNNIKVYRWKRKLPCQGIQQICGALVFMGRRPSRLLLNWLDPPQTFSYSTSLNESYLVELWIALYKSNEVHKVRKNCKFEEKIFFRWAQYARKKCFIKWAQAMLEDCRFLVVSSIQQRLGHLRRSTRAKFETKDKLCTLTQPSLFFFLNLN